MADMTLTDISKAMRDIDIGMMTTRASNGALASRPMSNNRDVDYDGDSYYFAEAKSSAAQSLETQPEVSLSFISKPLLGKNLYLAIEGKADLVRDKAEMKKHWTKDLDVWFKQGIDTPGIVMIRVRATRITYWHGMEEGTITL